jgi:tetratricopeptide (TPR) repeat protein
LYFWIYPAVAAGLVVFAIHVVRRRPLAAFGLLFFMANIAFVLQLIPVGGAIMADRYTYVASFGTCLVLASAWAAIGRSRSAARVGAAVLGAYVLTLAVLTYERCAVWKDSLTLWNDVLAKYPHAVPALNNRGRARYAAGDIQGAIADFTEILQWLPNDPRYLCSRGAARLRFGDLQGAKADFTGVIDAGSVMRTEAYVSRGSIARRLGDLTGAIADFTGAIAVDSHSAVAWSRRADAKYAQGDVPGAIGDYDRVLELQPGDAGAWFARGKAHIEVGQLARACADLEQAGRLGAPLAMELLREHCGQGSAPRP